MFTTKLVELVIDGVLLSENIKLYFEDGVEDPPDNWAIIDIFEDDIHIDSTSIHIEENTAYFDEVADKKLEKFAVERAMYYGIEKKVERIVMIKEKEKKEEKKLFKYMIGIYSSLDEISSDYKEILEKAKINFRNVCSEFRNIIDKSETLQNFEKTISRLL